MKNGLDEQYIDLLKDVLENGVNKNTRNGEVLSVFGRTIRYKFKDGKFPLLTTKKMAWKTIVTELLWFLRGDTNIKFLVDNGCNIWNGDAHKRYENSYSAWVGDSSWSNNGEPWDMENFIRLIKTDERFCRMFGELGPIYGKQWRKWRKPIRTIGESKPSQQPIDQIQNLINDLKTNPDSRRLMVSAWNPSDLPHQVLPPCHYGFQVYTRELSFEERWELSKKYKHTREDAVIPTETETYLGVNVRLELNSQWNDPTLKINLPTRAISLMFNMRSTDVGLGLGFNLASYGLLLMMIAKQVNMVPDELIYNGGDVHLYKNHVEPIKEQLNREPYPLPTVKLSDSVVNDIADYTLDDIVLENYQSHPTIKMPLSN